MAVHRFHPSILREYDIRGVVGETLSTTDVRVIGRCLGTQARRAGGQRAVVGRDGRLTSPEMETAMVEGLTATGIDVVRIGLVPTPMLYFADRLFAADVAVMVTGSHNPPDYNGLKMVLDGKPFYGEQIRGLADQAAGENLESGTGRAEERSVLAAYLDDLNAAFQRGSIRRHLKVAWDPGNGAAGPTLEALAERLSRWVDSEIINGRVDGTFPAHHPDPTEEKNLEQLRELVWKSGSEIGIAFDGDGDRIGVVDGRGRVLWGDQILTLLASDLLAEEPGATIIMDIKTSAAVSEAIERLGGRPVVWKTGHSLVKEKMAETGAALAGEMSGHIFYVRQPGGVGPGARFDDALYAAVRLLSFLARSDQSLAVHYDNLEHRPNTPEIRIDCADERKFQVIEDIRARARRAAEEARQRGETVDVMEIDGARVSSADGWWLVRASNTQPVLVARCEGRDAAALGRLKAELTAHLVACGVEARL
jgi:phosphomannomutase